MPQTILVLLHQRAEACDSQPELSLPQADQCERTTRLAVWFWLLLALALMALLVADSLISPTPERLW